VERDSAEADFAKWHPLAKDLFLWHLLEELEHRTVAFDVYQHVYGTYVHRLAVGLFAQRHLFRFMTRAADCLLRAHAPTIERLGGPKAHRARMKRLNRQLIREVLPRTLRTHARGYTPHRIAMPAMMQRFSEELGARMAAGD
jgi:predicted metal-dependent hydrolase